MLPSWYRAYRNKLVKMSVYKQSLLNKIERNFVLSVNMDVFILAVLYAVAYSRLLLDKCLLGPPVTCNSVPAESEVIWC